MSAEDDVGDDDGTEDGELSRRETRTMKAESSAECERS